MTTIQQKLMDSPLFQLSNGSKELFHSNMLFWISQRYPEKFLEILNKLHIDTSQWKDSWESHREKDHFDLSVTNMDGKYLLVLENKVKSIPYKIQLDEYQKKAGKDDKQQFLLLTLCTDFAQKDEIKKDGWKIANYYDLADAIRGILPQIHDIYHQELLNDYCLFIENLHLIQEQWTLNPSDKYYCTIVNAHEGIK